jgi:hypothetical protein
MKTSSSPVRRLVFATASALVLGAYVPASLQQPSGDAERAATLRVFQERVEAYAALHRRLEQPLPPLDVTRETVRNFVNRQLLANAIRKARAGAQPGDIFTPAVARVFRDLVSEALAGRDPEALLTELHEDHPETHRIRPTVNEPYPRGATQEVPPVLLSHLPALPEDVEYRIVNHDLVLWDIHANLVVDFVHNAFERPRALTERGVHQ